MEKIRLGYREIQYFCSVVCLNNMQGKHKKGGFTLIELLVVISIIGVLSTIAMTSLNGARMKARDARRLSDMEQIKTALELYYADHGAYPPMFSGPGSEACSAITSAPSGWLSPYMNTVPADPVWSGSLPHTYEYCQKYSGGFDTQTYVLWASLEASAGNVNSSVWPVGSYRSSGYNYVIANWTP